MEGSKNGGSSGKRDAAAGACRLLVSPEEKVTMLTLSTPKHCADLTARARAEFDEMPGLRLTLAQASRLCNASLAECQCVFDELIAEGFLCRVGGLYRRADVGRRCA
jgi:hypothetical protein